MTFDINRHLFKNRPNRKHTHFKWWVTDPTKNGARHKEDLHVTRWPRGKVLAGPFDYRQDARDSKKEICESRGLMSDFSWADDVLPGSY